MISNTPPAATVLRAEARKSFSLAVFITDPRGRYVDLTDCTLSIVGKAEPFSSDTDDTNIFAPDDRAIMEDPEYGYARFDLQASTLNQRPGEYPYVVVLNAAGFSSVIVKGVLEIVDNPETGSVSEIYTTGAPTQQINVLLQNANVVRVAVGGQLPPGMNYVRDDVLERIESFDPDSIAVVPAGGAPGYVLTKIGYGNYTMAWRPAEQGFAGLDATGRPAGDVPTTQGDGTWTWQPASVSADGIPADYVMTSDGTGGWYWESLDEVVSLPDWTAAAGAPGYVRNKPTLGSMASAQQSEFVPNGRLVSQMAGVHIVSSPPTSGTNGHLYFVYTE